MDEIEIRLECLKCAIETVRDKKDLDLIKDVTENYVAFVKGSATEENLAFPVESLKLNVRANNSLRADDIHTIGELTQRSRHDLMAIQGLGKKGVDEVVEALKSMGLTLFGKINE